MHERMISWLKTGYVVDPDTGCWNWQRSLTSEGYGKVHLNIDGKRIQAHAHRAMYELVTGQDRRFSLDHLCRNRRCVRPDHLEDVPIGINILRGAGPSAVNARRTECSHGHPLPGPNLKIVDGKRRCRICLRRRTREHREKWKIETGWAPKRNPTVCKRGHLWDEANTYISPRGQVACRSCIREIRRERNGPPRGPITHCPHGHAYDEANTLWRGNNRFCLTCKRSRGREDSRRRRAALKASS